ncbi:MAG: glucose-6-phosphate dehydrogenase [candidate division Zixibacteria bacterium]
MVRPENCIIVIFGASGDLARRKLIPGLYNKYRQKLLPENFAIVGVGRSSFSDDTFREKIKRGITSFDKDSGFLKKIYYQKIGVYSAAEFYDLRKRLSDIANESRIEENYIFYLSTPPGVYEDISRCLGAAGLNSLENGWKRIVVEKPFGSDLESARRLNTSIKKDFGEDQIFRIDHYLGKETVQNVLALRFANGIFEPLWNGKYINHVEISSAEYIGIEKRGAYYDNAGALRDMVQNHMLQLVGLIAMEPPSSFDARTVRDETQKVFQTLRPMTGKEIAENVVRGQYTSSTVKGQKVSGYRDEEGVAPDSRTETFAAMKFYVDNWRWGGVPFYIRTGKRLPTRVTEAVINFKKTPHYIFSRGDTGEVGCNQLIIRIQPDEGILLKFGIKTPGAGFQIKNVGMDFHYSDLADSEIQDAYEKLLLDCMHGDATLYARADAVDACWAFVDPILEEWKNNSELKVYGYPAGTWGPKEASALFDETDIDWRYPCKNLANDGIYCEL